MKASIVDLRTSMRDITKALSRFEDVVIYSHGRPIAVMSSVKEPKSTEMSVTDHPFFGSGVAASETVDEIMGRLRGGRY